jgi:mono/diheme cytochrome c family protein
MKTLIAFIAGSILSALAVVAAGLLGWLPSNATSEPPKWENAIGARALDASLEKRARDLKNPIRAGDPAARAAGARIYADNCAGCHGDSKGPSAWGSKGMYPRVPQFFHLKENELTAEEAYAAIHDGIRYSGMGAWRDVMKDGDIWKVANFVAHPRENRNPAPPKSAH